ncbi:MAG: RNA polymerase sigma factor [Pseudonocardiaceae bacterium]
MDQREWGRLRETVLRRTQASGASREDAEDATNDALLAAIGQPEHARSQLAWLSTVAQRRRVDLIRRRVREQQVPTAGPGAPDPTAAGPEDVVVERAHASWLAASLTQLPPTTREVVDAVGSGMAPSEVARSMNLSARSVESHLTRARRHLRRMGALAVPVGLVLGWAVRARPGSRMALAAMAVAIPVVVTVVALLPSSTPIGSHPDVAPGAPGAPGTALPAPGPLVITPRGDSTPGLAGFGEVPVGAAPDGRLPASAAGRPGEGTAQPVDSAGQPQGQLSPAPPPAGRSLPPQRCLLTLPLTLPLLGELGCVLGDLVDGVVEAPLPEQVPVPLPER